jgi:hypothetical protein
VYSLYVGGGMRDTSSWQFSMHNTGAAPCFVGSTLAIAFIAAQGKLMLSPLPTRTDIVYLAGSAGSSSASISKAAVGEIDSFCVLPPINEMDISPGPGLGLARVTPGPAGGSGAACTGKDDRYLAEVYNDQCCTAGYAASIQSSIAAPAAVHPGEHVRFLVTLTNRPAPHSEIGGTVHPAPPALTFSPCPTYHEELEGVAGSFHTYQLNCNRARTILANQSETFEMFIDVPNNAHTGPSVLLWSIDESPTIWQTMRTNIEIGA